MNWALYVEWTNKKQQWHKARVEHIELLSDEEEDKDVIPHTEKEERNPIVNVVDIFSNLITMHQMLKFLHFKYVRFWGLQNSQGCIRLVTLSMFLFLFLVVYNSCKSCWWLEVLHYLHWSKVGWNSKGFDFNESQKASKTYVYHESS